MFCAPVLLPHKRINLHIRFFVCLCFRVGCNVGPPQQSIFNHSYNVSLFHSYLCDSGWVHARRTTSSWGLARRFPLKKALAMNFVNSLDWFNQASHPLIDTSQNFQVFFKVTAQHPWRESSSPSARWLTFLALRRPMMSPRESCSGRNKVLKRGHQHRIHEQPRLPLP